jgi:hypothetical protein
MLTVVRIIHPECNSVVVTEIELREIPMEMAFTAVLVDPLHPTLE